MRDSLYPGKKINKTNAAKMLNEINKSLQKIGKQMENTKTEIDVFCSEPDLEGRGFSSIKDYFNNGHGNVLHAFSVTLNAIINSNLKVSRKINSTISQSGDLEYDDIYTGYTEIYNLIEDLEDEATNLLNEPIFRSDKYNIVCSNLRAQRRLLSKTEKTLDELEAFFAYTEGGAESIWTQLENLRTQIHSFISHGGYDEDKRQYVFPESSSLKQILNNLEKIASDNKYEIEDLDPINMATGNYIYNKRFLEILGIYPITFTITYNSASNSNEANISRGWTHNFDVRIITSDATAEIIINSGRRETYTLKSGKYVNDHGDSDRVLARVIEDKAGFCYKYTNEKNEKYYFNKNGECVRIECADGALFTLAYDCGLLKTVRTKNECGYDFEYEEKDGIYVVKHISDTAGRKIAFVYEEREIGSRKRYCLTSVSDEESAIYKYGYDDSGRMNQVTNARGTVNIINKYDISGRVINQVFPDEGECILTYDDNAGCIEATLQNGSDVRYFHDNRARNTRTEYPNGTEKYTFTDSNARASHTDKNGNVTVFEYNEYGDLTKETDPAGNVYETEYDENRRVVAVKINDETLRQAKYDSAGNLIEETDAIGRKTKSEYITDLPLSITNADGTIIHFAYDDKGNITELIDENGNKTQYTYDSLNRVVEAMDANGNIEKYSYNNRNEIMCSINPAGDSRFFEYNESGKLIHAVDYDGNEEFAEYNELNKISAYVDKDGNRTEYGYDIMWNLSSIKDAEGNVSLRTHDKYGNISRETDALYATTSYSYDAEGNLIRQKDAEGAYIDFEYDSLNRMTKAKFSDGTEENYEHDVLGNVTKFTDSEGSEWLSEYNLAGELIKEIDPDGVETVYTYDLRGNLILEETEGVATRYEYDKMGNLIKKINPDDTETIYAYDSNNNLKSETANGVTLSYSYDCLNRVIEIRREGDLVKSFGYDSVGNKISETDALGNMTRYIRSKAGDIITAIDALGNETHYTYDRCHRLMSIDQGEGRVTTYSRDAVGNITSITDPLGNVETYKYNRRGEVIEKIDRDGNATKIVRNNYGDVARIKYADSTEVEYSYDALRRLKEVRDSLGRTLIERDKLGRETKISDHKGRTVFYEYDKLGNRTGITYPNGKKVAYEFDRAGKTTKVISDDLEAVISYDEFGRISQISRGNLNASYKYDKFSRLSELSHIQDGKLINQETYLYDADDNILSNGLADFEYDSLNRLTKVSKKFGITREYYYDAFGNRTSLNENGTVVTYLYDNANQLTSSSDGYSYKYDKRGNMVERTLNGETINTYVYGANNRLVRARNSKDETATYKYNGLGFRVTRSAKGKDIEYILDQTQMYNNMLQSGDDTYIWDEDNLLFKGATPQIRDRLGSDLDAAEFGLGAKNFASYIYDDVSDTFFAQAREYLPAIGRFSGRDILKGEVEIPRTLNEYAYCFNNPLAYADLDGMKPTAASNSISQKVDEFAKKGAVYLAIDKAGDKLHAIVKMPLDKWEQQALKNIDKTYDRTIRKYTNRALNNPRSGRVANAVKKLANTDVKKASDIAKVTTKSKAASKLAKAGPGAIVAAAGVALDYRKDTKAGLTKSKRRTNFIVNASFATAGIAATVLIASGPIGVAVGIGLVGFEIIASDFIKNKWNSLD